MVPQETGNNTLSYSLEEDEGTKAGPAAFPGRDIKSSEQADGFRAVIPQSTVAGPLLHTPGPSANQDKSEVSEPITGLYMYII